MAHVVEAGLAALRPQRGPDGAGGEDLAAAGLVGQLHPFAVARVDDRVLAHHIAAAQHGIKHKVQREWQIEPGAGRSIPRGASNEPEHYIFHYTYGIEYSLAGLPQTGSIGEWG